MDMLLFRGGIRFNVDYNSTLVGISIVVTVLRFTMGYFEVCNEFCVDTSKRLFFVFVLLTLHPAPEAPYVPIPYPFMMFIHSVAEITIILSILRA